MRANVASGFGYLRCGVVVIAICIVASAFSDDGVTERDKSLGDTANLKRDEAGEGADEKTGTSDANPPEGFIGVDFRFTPPGQLVFAPYEKRLMPNGTTQALPTFVDIPPDAHGGSAVRVKDDSNVDIRVKFLFELDNQDAALFAPWAEGNLDGGAGEGESALHWAVEAVGVGIVEIQINNTLTETDDIVRLKSELPVHRFTVPCRIRLREGGGGDKTVHLSEAGGKLRFPVDAARSLLLPSSGEWVSFEISGELASAELNDATIVVRETDAGGTVIGKEDATVFYWGEPQIAVTARDPYEMIETVENGIPTMVYGPVPEPPSLGQGVSYSGRATLMPAGLDCSAPQLQHGLGFVQNIRDVEIAVFYDHAAIVEDLQNPPVRPITVDRWHIERVTLSEEAGRMQDTEGSLADPLQYIWAPAFQMAKCSEPTTIAASDSPNAKQPKYLFTLYPDQNQNEAVLVRYAVDRMAYNAQFDLWLVTAEPLFSNDIYPLRQTSWDLQADSAFGTPPANAAGGDAAPTVMPTIGEPFFNNWANENGTSTAEGAVTFE